MTSGAGSLARSAYRRFRRRGGRAQPARPRIAFLAPLPPAPTGVATYSRAVLDGLGRIGFFDRHGMDAIWPVRPRDEGLDSRYRLGVYAIGNHVEFHHEIYRFACRSPGLIVLHDLALDDFVRGLWAAGDPLGFLAERDAVRLRSRLGWNAGSRTEPLDEPLCANVLRRSRGVIVHSSFAKRYVQELGSRTPVFVVSHPVVESRADMDRAKARREERRARIGVGREDVLVVAPGDMNAAKQLEPLLAAIAMLPLSVKVALVGRRQVDGYDVDALVGASGLGSRVALEPNVSDADFLAWLFAADVVVDLRHPHRGESSGSLARAMQAGRPSIVSATGSYLDVPDELVLRVAPGPADPQELAARIRLLADDPDLRARMGTAARNHVAHLAASEATAHGYEDAIDRTLTLVGDPGREAEARWAAALSDVGVGEPAAHRGYGLSYMRAMESFRAGPARSRRADPP